jgi:hypothetical protein
LCLLKRDEKTDEAREEEEEEVRKRREREIDLN